MLARLLPVTIALAALPLSTLAQDITPMLHGNLELSLDDAIKMGLENNLDVQITRYAPLIAGYDATGSWGAFDPTASAEFGTGYSITPNSVSINQTTSARSRKSDGFGALSGLVPLLGSEYSFRFDGVQSTTNSAIEGLSPKFDSGWSLSFRQPLLKDLIWNQPWTQVHTTRLGFESAQEDFRTALMNTVSLIEDAYWGLIAAEERVRASQQSLKTARALLDQSKTQYEVGVVSRVAVSEAESGVARREFELIRETNSYRNQQDILIDLILGPGLHAASTLEIEPTDRPEEYIEYEIDLESAVARAFENRPELASAIRAIETQNVNLRFAKNQRLPSLDAVVTYGQTGLAGSQNPDLNCNFTSNAVACANGTLVSPGNYGDSTDVWNENPAFTARGVFSMPFPNTTARANASRADIELRRANTLLKRLEQDIILEVRRAARGLAASQEGIVAAERALAAATEQLRAEEIKNEYGESTPFDVLQREDQFVEAERGLITAYQAYRTSATQLDRAQGTILRNRNIRIESAAALR